MGVIERNEFGIDDVRLLVSPVEGLEVVLVLLLIGPNDAILIH